jgi:hypothetical protein
MSMSMLFPHPGFPITSRPYTIRMTVRLLMHSLASDPPLGGLNYLGSIEILQLL